MLRAIKVRLYPNKVQEQELNKVLGSYRFVYNHMLAKRQKAYETDKTILSVLDLQKYFHGTLLKDDQYAWLREQDTKVMKYAIRQMDDAYKMFFRKCNGFPRFKSKKDKQSASFSREAISRRNTFETKHITLIKSLKNIRFRCSELYHRRLQRYKDNIRSATLSKTKSGNFFLSISIEVSESEYVKLNKTNRQVGLDLGVKDFVITSDGVVFENKHFFKKEEKKIAKLQRQLSRKVKGSNNRNKQRVRLAKAFEHLTNKKENYIHYVVNEVLKSYDVVFMEDLNVQGRLRNHSLAKAIQEIGFYRFKSVLQTKASQNGKEVYLIDRFYPSSKTCSCCGHKKQDLKLSDRSWTCPGCGEHHDRDLNAARNILLEGQRKLQESV